MGYIVGEDRTIVGGFVGLDCNLTSLIHVRQPNASAGIPSHLGYHIEIVALLPTFPDHGQSSTGS
ncbi:hypothetical protein [Synechococcus sp. O70.2]|uniref:hypothetical protein n=1 Tax=Synechococcus sp. O70.2 TaxID=2964533 RepID=UPI0039C4E2C6